MVKNETNILIAVSSSMLGLSLLASAVAMPPGVNAASSSASASVTVSAACTLSGANHNYYDTISGGETKTFGPSSIKATCNDTAGYSLYAIGFSGDSYSGNNTKMIGTNTSIDTATSGNNSRWSMQVASVAGTYTPTIMNSFDSAHVIPADYAQVAKYTSLTDGGNNAEGSNLQVSYTVSISSTQAVDTYTGKVKYTLVHPNTAPTPVIPLPETACSASQICYAPNANDIDGSMSSLGVVTGSSTAGKVTGVSTNGTTALIAPNYSREGYGFAGWSTEFDATTATNPVIFGPNQTITTSTTAGAGDADVSQHGLILYPVWIESAGNLQGWTGCSSLTAASYNSTTGVLSATLASMTALTDQRDGNVYTVARLADGNCWMTENLRLDADDTLGDTNKALAQGYGTSVTYGNFTGLAPSEDANFTDTNPPVANSLYSTDGTTTNTIQGGDSFYYYARMPRYNNNNTNRNLTPSYNGAGSGTYYQWYGYGNYYTWPAAIASVKKYSSPTATDDEGKTSETAGTSLCPTGWQLPYGRDTGNGATTKGFSYLDTRMGGSGATANSSTTPTGADRSKMWRQFPNNFVYSGYFYMTSANNRNSYGYYWSSTADSNYVSYSLFLNSSSLIPGTKSYNKYSGRSIRCLASS